MNPRLLALLERWGLVPKAEDTRVPALDAMDRFSGEQIAAPMHQNYYPSPPLSDDAFKQGVAREEISPLDIAINRKPRS